MAIPFRCPSCQALLSVDDQHLGKQVKCAHCGKMCKATSAVDPDLPTVLQQQAEKLLKTPKKRQ
jgi:predicted Zn finger-like uncharacterized protein